MASLRSTLNRFAPSKHTLVRYVAAKLAPHKLTGKCYVCRLRLGTLAGILSTMKKIILIATSSAILMTLVGAIAPATALRKCTNSDNMSIRSAQTWVDMSQREVDRERSKSSKASQDVNSAQIKVNARNLAISKLQTEISRATSQTRIRDLQRQVTNENSRLQQEQRDLQSRLKSESSAMTSMSRAETSLSQKLSTLNRQKARCSQ